MNYRFTPDARDELADAVGFYESQRHGLGAEFAVDVGVGIARILDAPNRWSEVEPGIRKYRIHRFPYGIFYRVPDARSIEVIAVFDLRRQPGSWRRRFS
jgi:plasmid stabilization system protein ParE